MTTQQIDAKLARTTQSIKRLDERINWLLKKVEYRRRRIRELGKLRNETLSMNLPLEP
jgi:hypothetical protein